MKYAFICILTLCLVFFVSKDLFARAGGGESFSSSSSSSSSSSGSSSSSDFSYSDSDDEELGPCGMIIVFIIVIIVIIGTIRDKKSTHSAETIKSMPFSRSSLRKVFPCGQQQHLLKGSVSGVIDEYRKLDHNFSRPMFLDFAQLLYARYHITRATQELSALSFYIAEDIIEKASKASENAKKIESIIIGSARIVALQPDSGDSLDRIAVAFEANYDETIMNETILKNGTKEKKPITGEFEISEIWHFVRKAGTMSPDNKPIKSITCPSCGASAETDNKGSCKSCGNTVSDGSFYWILNRIEVLKVGIKPPIQLGYGGVEQGTELKTVCQNNLNDSIQKFEGAYPGFVWPEFSKYVKEVFFNIQYAWTHQKWEKARPFETDHLFNMHNYWIEKYNKEKKRNVLENIKIKDVKVCKVEMDKYYDSITVRIFASMKDSTVKMNAVNVSSSSVPTTSFSEYWTFIRKSGVNPKQLSAKECPNCGAELNVNMSGVCEYCSSKISSGEFSWVLSMIEQDEIYIG